MKPITNRRIALLPITLSVLLLAACGPGGNDAGRTRSTALWGKNVTLTAEGAPKAEITAEGDFIVDGKKLAVNASQRALLVAYHRELGGIADAGIATGKEGAKLAGKAVGAAVKGIFSGEPDRIEQEIEAEAKKVEAEAMKICDRLPGLYQAQQNLAAALPEFTPYASMDSGDVEDCRSDQTASYEAGNEVGKNIGQAIKGDGDNASERMNAADEANAAAATPEEAPKP